ncbi:MAG: hypothetical protein J2P13_09855 [Acidobacteria bacterium]|nr:hypothetical protein [Acidobacteriota bacterium]
MPAVRKYQAPSAGVKFFNRALGLLAGFGIAPPFIYLLEVRGRKSGKLYSTAVNLLELNRKQLLVAPRGRTQRALNAEAAGEVTLKRGVRRNFRLRALTGEEKPEALKTCLTHYRRAVARFFPIKPEAPLEEFRKISGGYPVFELRTGQGTRFGNFARRMERREAPPRKKSIKREAVDDEIHRANSNLL